MATKQKDGKGGSRMAAETGKDRSIKATARVAECKAEA